MKEKKLIKDGGITCCKCKRRMAVCDWGVFAQCEEGVEYTCAMCNYKESTSDLAIEKVKVRLLKNTIKDIVGEIKND